MNEYEKMSMEALEAEIKRTEDSNHGAWCYLDPRYEYGRRLFYGIGMHEDKKRGLIYWKQYCRNHPLVRLQIGECYFEGEVVVQNYNEALEWLGRLDSVQAYLLMGKCYLKLGNESKAFEYFQKAAKEKGVAGEEESRREAETFVGLCYNEGIGIGQDDKKAFEYFEKAAGDGGDSGNLVAQYYLVKCYQEGRGTKQDLNMAGFWSLRCFERNYKEIVQKMNGFLHVDNQNVG